MGTKTLTATGALVLAAVLIWAALAGRDGSPPGRRPAPDASGLAYVGSTTCRECHQAEYDAWRGSHHDLAMQDATPESVAGDFDDATFTDAGVTTGFFRRGDRFFVNAEGPDGRQTDYEIRYAFGVEPLQQYLVEFPGGRLQNLTVAWDTERRAWFSLYPGERFPAGDPFHWTGTYQRWNGMCAECHSTHLRKNFDAASETYATAWDEIDVACEACHGPGEAHAAWARDGGPDRAAPTGSGLLANLGASAGDEVDACAGCHSRRQMIAATDGHGRPYLDDFLPATLRAGLYHPDGQILDEVYVYGSFLQSRMHAAGVRCSDCHDPHRLTLVATGDGVCTQCHREDAAARTPAPSPGRYGTPAHHFHDPASSGARCVNCHMPERTYMVVDPRRDHGFRVPRPDLSVTLGTPNACTSCHDDRSAEWAAAQAAAWWGPPRPPGFAGIIARGRAADPAAAADLARLAGSATVPGIVRATALELLQQYGPDAWPTFVAAAGDADPLVRVAAAAGLEALPPPERPAALVGLLDDPVRAVRLEAARVLAGVPQEMFAAAAFARLQEVLDDYVDAQRQMADLPASRLRLAVLHAQQGDARLAEREYLAALRLDPAFLPARFNLANLYNALGRNAEAESVLREGLARVPEEGELHYSLGLLLAEVGRLEEAETSLARAAARLPARARVRYNHAVALLRLGRSDDAEAALLAAFALDARDPDVLLALSRFYLDRGALADAERFALALVERLPGEPGAERLLAEIRARRD